MQILKRIYFPSWQAIIIFVHKCVGVWLFVRLAWAVYLHAAFLYSSAKF